MKNEEPILYLNRYECSECGTKWVNESPCKGADQECPECGAVSEPYESEESPIARIQRYMKTGENICPYCGTAGLNFGSLDVDPDCIREQVSCNDCGKKWTDTYTLSSMIESDGNIIDRVD